LIEDLTASTVKIARDTWLPRQIYSPRED
jgi:hypothetical protein